MEQSRRTNLKYQAEEISFRARVDPDRLPQDLRGVPMAAIVDSVRQLFQSLISRTTGGLAPSNLVRICIQADSLDKPISTTLMPVSSLTVEKVLSSVMKVLQSKENIKLDYGFLVDVVIINRPVGGGRRKICNIPMDRLNKKSILSIPEDDSNLCCAKAIVYALAHLRNDRAGINAMRDRRRPALLNRARALHEAAGVPLGPCTYSEVSQFEQFLNVQIVVLSSDNMNQVS